MDREEAAREEARAALLQEPTLLAEAEAMDYERGTPRTSLQCYSVDLEQRSFTKRELSPFHIEFPTGTEPAVFAISHCASSALTAVLCVPLAVAPSVAGKAHRYVYSTAGASATVVTPQRGILKTDTLDMSRSQLWLPPTPCEYCGEPIFTPRSTAREGQSGVNEEIPSAAEEVSGSSAEDDGYLLTLCFDGSSGTSSLLVLDARNVGAGPIARVPVSEEADLAHLPEDAEIAGPGHGLHGTFVSGLAPDLATVRAAEEARARAGGRFLSDTQICSWQRR